MKTDFAVDPNVEESKVGNELSDVDFEKVFKEYEEQLVFPDKKPERVFFVAIAGLIATGKTTIMKALSERLGLLRISTDDVRRLLLKHGFNFVRTRQIAGELAFKYAAEGYAIAVDSDAAGAFVTTNINKLIEQVPGPIFWLHTVAPEDLIFERLHESNAERDYTGEEAIRHYHRRKALHENLTMPFMYTFDTSRDDLEKQLDEAEGKILGKLNCVNMPTKSYIIIITGLTCTGKTTLARRLGDELQIPAIGKDEIKEYLFDTIGWKDREWSRKLGAASIGVLYIFIRKLFQTGRSFIVENTFLKELDSSKFQDMIKEFGFEPIQINCVCNGEVLFERFKQRSESEERHPGHVDSDNYEEYRDMILEGRREPLDIGGTVIEFDSTNIDEIDYDEMEAKILKKLNQV